MSIKSVMQKAANKIKPAIRKELKAQGHYLSGNLERSLTDTILFGENGTKIEGTALGYARFLDEGFPAESANWGQLPFLIKFFVARGFEAKEAKQAAAATIVKWMKEGMPTDGSKRFSKTGNRKMFIEIVGRAIDNDIDKIILDGLDKEIDKTYHKTKSETI